MSFKNHKNMKEEQLKNLIYATYANDMVLMLNGFSEVATATFGQKQHARLKKNTKEIKSNVKELDKYPRGVYKVSANAAKPSIRTSLWEMKSPSQLIDIKDDHK